MSVAYIIKFTRLTVPDDFRNKHNCLGATYNILVQIKCSKMFKIDILM